MKKFSKLDLFLIERSKKTRLPLGSLIYAKKDKLFPKGIIGKVISYNTFECEYHITTVLNSIASNMNPYILENEENGFKITQEEFDNAEFVRYKDAVEIDLEPELPVVKFLKESIIAKLALGVLLMGSGALIALEFLK